ncbi:MAG: hypothetical protein H7Y30_13135, partial [Pyrinomonadaceae bacterium]|nr:hypothetical protein [Pyrinomonadaceae bacterium]
IVLSLSLSLCNLADKLRGSKNDNNTNASGANSNSNASGPGAADLPPAERPEPTAAQTAALAGGQSITWDQQGITWTVPPKWTKMSTDSKSFNWQSPSPFAFLLTNISVFDASFPADISLKATFDQHVSRQKNGEVAEVRWLELDGVRGVQFLETPPEAKDGIRRMQWIAYRKYAGQTQMVNIMLSSEGQHFDKHKDALYGILYSTKLVHD